MIAVCLEHLERAIDEYVVEREQAPDIYMVRQLKDQSIPIPATCRFCNQEPKYILTKTQLPA